MVRLTKSSHLEHDRNGDDLCHRLSLIHSRLPFGRVGNEVEHHGIQFLANALGKRIDNAVGFP